VRRKNRPEPPPPLATSTAERLAAIVEAAERAAVAVIDDAEKQADRHLEEAREEADRLVAERLASLSELTDSLVAQAEAIRDQAERLTAALEETKPERPARSSHLTAVEEEPIELKPHQPGRGGASAGARLLATQMAVSGSSREEIEARLRNGFEIEDTASILDAILGPED
jgi:vacuolar-type H+-ATPase subunit H